MSLKRQYKTDPLLEQSVREQDVEKESKVNAKCGTIQ